MKNTFIKKVIQILSSYKEQALLNDYSITTINTETVEEFFVLQKLETTRTTDTSEIHVTVYKSGENDTLGQASFMIPHEMKKEEIEELINKALYSASFVHNKKYDLVKGTKKMKKVRKMDDINPFDLLQDAALTFIQSSINEKDYSIAFNSLECFFTKKRVHLMTSQNVDYEKETVSMMIESIPSFTDKGTNFKTELYRMFKYGEINDSTLAKVKEDAKNAIDDCRLRAKAIQNTVSGKMDIIMKDRNVAEMLYEVIGSYNYSSVYNKSNLHEIGEMVQEKPKTKLNIKLCKATKEDFFDGEGILLEDKEIIKNGVLTSYFGSNRFASYLGLKPTGALGLLKAKPGKKTIDELRKDPHIEIIDLSGLQIDLYQGYIGGEIRLATYFDGITNTPISGLSFSASLKEVLNNFEFASEVVTLLQYNGPKYIKMKNVDIN